jgi:integrase/recombinase XerD
MLLSTYYNGYRLYLQLEKNLSKNTVEAYLRDISKMDFFCKEYNIHLDILNPTDDFFTNFIKWISNQGHAASSQARIISGIRSFYDYLMLEKLIDRNPTELIDFPRLSRKLPTYLTHQEIELMLSQIDQSSPSGFRNRVILELLFACGLRVSELINLEKSHIYFKDECILVTGKGNKQRLIPISQNALNLLEVYLIDRNQVNTSSKDQNILFLNHRGGKISRISIFNIVKDLAAKAGIRKNISPHTFRHSFATGLVSNGADLRAVQNMLGHESITTTEIYTHLDRKHLQKVIDTYHPRANKNKP